MAVFDKREGKIMVNLCFSESTKGSLKYTFRSRGEQVACLPLLLFCGNIKNVYNIENAEISLREFTMLTGKDEEVRIWYSSADAGEYCGLLHAVTMLTDCRLTVVDCNRDVRSGNSVTHYRNTAALDEEVMLDFLQYEYAPEPEKLQEWRECFTRLQEENAPLRVIEKGRIISADINYYDKMIGQHLSAEENSIARIIGAVIGQRDGIPFSDTFIAGRLQSFLDRGIIELVTKKEDFYRSTVKLTVDVDLI